MGTAALLGAAFLLGWCASDLIIWAGSYFQGLKRRKLARVVSLDGSPGPKVYRKSGKRKPVVRDEADEFAAEIREREKAARQ
jgi:hypothetical protein